MNNFIEDINKTILENGKKALKHCITKYIFGEHKIVNLSDKDDKEKIDFITGLEKELVLSYELYGKNGIQKALNKYGIK